MKQDEKKIVELLVHDLKGELRDLKIILEGQKSLESSILFRVEMMNEMLLGVEDFYSFYHRELEKSYLDLSSLFNDCYEKIKERNSKRDIDFKIDLGAFKKDPKSAIQGDKVLIKKSLSLLIENAWKFTKDVPNAAITFGEEDVKGEHFFYIYNNGPNLPHEVNIFDLFYGKRSGHDKAGLGIGLPLAKLIFEKHGGRLWAKNNEEGGVKFYFKF